MCQLKLNPFKFFPLTEHFLKKNDDLFSFSVLLQHWKVLD